MIYHFDMPRILQFRDNQCRTKVGTYRLFKEVGIQFAELLSDENITIYFGECREEALAACCEDYRNRSKEIEHGRLYHSIGV